MKVVPKVVEINNLLTVQLKKNNHELDHIEKNILVHPNIPAPPPWILNGSPLMSFVNMTLHPRATHACWYKYSSIINRKSVSSVVLHGHRHAEYATLKAVSTSTGTTGPGSPAPCHHNSKEGMKEGRCDVGSDDHG